MPTQANKELVLGLVDEVWNQHDATAIDRSVTPADRSRARPAPGGILTGTAA